MLLPYNQARYHVFQQLQAQFPYPPVVPISHGPIIDETALAKRVTEMILPSLAEMIEKAVSSAFNGVNLLSSSQRNNTEDVESHSSNLNPEPICLNQPIRKSQQVENYVSDGNEKEPVNNDMPDEVEEQRLLFSPTHLSLMVCKSQPV